jgi:hypothetical protein
MPRKLKVYSWMSFADHKKYPRHGQVRRIVAATSMKEAARLDGGVWSAHSLDITETGNPLAVATAMAKPGTVFQRGINEFGDKPFDEVRKQGGKG